MKRPRQNAGKAGTRLTKKSLFEAPADFTFKQYQTDWDEFLEARQLKLSAISLRTDVNEDQKTCLASKVIQAFRVRWENKWKEPRAKLRKQNEAAWKKSLRTQPPIAAQPIPKPEIRMSDELAAKRAKVPPRLSENQRLIGKLPLNLSAGGLDAALWPWIKRWIENPLNKNAGEWRLISDQRRYLCALVNLAMRPNSKEAKAQRAFTDSVAPNLTCRVLPMLRRRLKKLTPKDYFAVTRNPTPEVDEKFSARQHDKRAKLRVGLKSLPKFI